MTIDEFTHITRDIQKHLEPGETYTLRFHFSSADVLTGEWVWLTPETPASSGIIVVSAWEKPPFYVPISSIEYIRLGSTSL